MMTAAKASSSTRLARPARLAQLLACAVEIIASDGLLGLTIRELSRIADVSESLVYTFFPSRDDLLVALARRELAALAEHLNAPQVVRGSDHQERVDQITIASLELTAQRGELLQTLLADPHLRGLIRQDYQKVRGSLIQRQALGAMEAFDIPMELGLAHTHITFAISLRVGKHLAGHAISLEEAVRFCHGIQHCGTRYRASDYARMRQTSLFSAANL